MDSLVFRELIRFFWKTFLLIKPILFRRRHISIVFREAYFSSYHL